MADNELNLKGRKRSPDCVTVGAKYFFQLLALGKQQKMQTCYMVGASAEQQAKERLHI